MTSTGHPERVDSIWRSVAARYQNADLRRSVWQIVNTFVPYLALWYIMLRSLDVSYWLTLVLIIPAAGLLVRIFIIFHDCGHGSFFRSRRANDILGVISGMFVFVPYHEWRHNHALHHATGSNLDHRGVGDVWMLTVEEYRALPPWKRLGYRLYRNPFVMFGLGPIFVFLISHRFPSRASGPKERRGIFWTNIALAILIALLGLAIGVVPFVVIMLPTIWLAGLFGIWLFYVQHQFEGSYWARDTDWSFDLAGLRGSSFYKLPAVLRWFSGNIGFHHIHHLNPRIPNYFLGRCQDETPVFRSVRPLTLLSSLRSLALRLWDEQGQRMVGFAALRNLPRPRPAEAPQ